MDKAKNRVYLATEVKACNLPISVRAERSTKKITVTVVGTKAPADKMCPDYVRPVKGYVQLSAAIGDRSIAHAPTKPGGALVTP